MVSPNLSPFSMTERLSEDEITSELEQSFNLCVQQYCSVTPERLEKLFGRMRLLAQEYVTGTFRPSSDQGVLRDSTLAAWMNDEPGFIQRVREQEVVLTGEQLPLRDQLQPAA